LRCVELLFVLKGQLSRASQPRFSDRGVSAIAENEAAAAHRLCELSGARHTARKTGRFRFVVALRAGPSAEAAR
jgi:hypothetical protein